MVRTKILSISMEVYLTVDCNPTVHESKSNSRRARARARPIYLGRSRSADAPPTDTLARRQMDVPSFPDSPTHQRIVVSVCSFTYARLASKMHAPTMLYVDVNFEDEIW